MKLFEDLKKCKGRRRQYRIKPSIRFHVDRENYYFAFLPTILWMPWVYRYPGFAGVIDIWWLHFHVLIGEWELLSCGNCVHQKTCIDAERIEWYTSDVFENGEKCRDFESK